MSTTMHDSEQRTNSSTQVLLPGLGASFTLVGAIWTAVAFQDAWGGGQNPVIASDLRNDGVLLVVLGLALTGISALITARRSAHPAKESALLASNYIGLALVAVSVVHGVAVLWSNATELSALGMDSSTWLLRYDGLPALAGLVLLCVSRAFARYSRPGEH